MTDPEKVNPFIIGTKIKCDSCDDTFIVGSGGTYWEIIVDSPDKENLVSAKCPKCLMKEMEKMNRGKGYCPHDGMGHFTCPNCGCGEWVSYPQAVPTDGRKWTYEYHCARCGKMMGLTLKGDE